MNFGCGCGILQMMWNNKEKLTPGRRKKVAAVLADIMANAQFNPPLRLVPDPRGERCTVQGTIGKNISIKGSLARGEAIEQTELFLKYCDPDNHEYKSICSLWLKGRMEEHQASHVAIFSPTLPEIKLPKTPGVSVICAPGESPNALVDQIYQAVSDSKQLVVKLEKLAANRQRVVDLLELVKANRVDMRNGNFTRKIGANVTCWGSQRDDGTHKRLQADLMRNGEYIASIGLREGKINQLWLASAQYEEDGWHTKTQEALDDFFVFHTRDQNPNTVVEDVCDIVEQSLLRAANSTPKLHRFNFPWRKVNGREK